MGSCSKIAQGEGMLLVRRDGRLQVVIQRGSKLEIDRCVWCWNARLWRSGLPLTLEAVSNPVSLRSLSKLVE